MHLLAVFLRRSWRVLAMSCLAMAALYSAPASANDCTVRRESISDANTGQSWSRAWHCKTEETARLYVGANDSTPVATSKRRTSALVCYRRGRRHAGGDDVWYYTQGGEALDGWAARQGWGYVPGADVKARSHSFRHMPKCRPDMWQSKKEVSDPNSGTRWSTVWYAHNDDEASLYRETNTTTPVAVMDSRKSWFVCYARGVTHSGGNDIWYYTRGDRSVAGMASRQAWGYMPSSAVHASKHPYDAIPACTTPGATPPSTPSPAGPYALPLPYGAFTSAIAALNTNHGQPNYWAVDLLVPEGTPVYSVSAGVVQNYSQGTCGNGLTVLGDDGMSYLYCHGSRYAGVAPGARVTSGQLLLYSGNTGQSGRPHLHLEIRRWMGDWDTSQGYCAHRFLRAVYDGHTQSPLQFPATTGDCRAAPASGVPSPTPGPGSECVQRAESYFDPNTQRAWNSVWYCRNRRNALIYATPDFTPDPMVPEPLNLGSMDGTPSWFVCYARGAVHAGGNDVWYYTLGDRFSSPRWAASRAFIGRAAEPWGYMPASELGTTVDPHPGIPECGFTPVLPPPPTTPFDSTLRVTVKNFIAHIGSRMGKLPFCRDSIFGTDPPGEALRLLAFLAFVEVTDRTMSEDPTDDQPRPNLDRRGYRLFSNAEIAVTRQGDQIVNVRLARPIDLSAGKEFWGGGWWQGTIFIRKPFTAVPVSATRWKVEWGVAGGPNDRANTLGLEPVCPRHGATNIWYDVSAYIDTSSGTLRVESLVVDGSQFPSRRWWLNGVQQGEVRQGNASALWERHPDDPTRVY